LRPIIHSQLKLNPSDRDVAGVDFFLVEEGKLMEQSWRLADRPSAVEKQERHVLNVTIHADDWFAHYVSNRVSNGKRGADNQKFSLAFTLRIDRYVSITEYSAANRLVNKQIPKTSWCNDKRVQPDDATANL
jgi:hypothetical protein